jgi:hypothetical protein
MAIAKQHCVGHEFKWLGPLMAPTAESYWARDAGPSLQRALCAPRLCSPRQECGHGSSTTRAVVAHRRTDGHRVWPYSIYKTWKRHHYIKT